MAVLCSILDLRAPSCHRMVAAVATIRAPPLAESAASITRFWTPTAQLAATVIALAASAAPLSRCVASQAAATRTSLLQVEPLPVVLPLAQLELVPPQEVPPLVEPQLAEPPLVKTEEQEAPLANLQLPQVLQVPHPLSQVMLPANLLPQVEMRKATLLL